MEIWEILIFGCNYGERKHKEWNKEIRKISADIQILSKSHEWVINQGIFSKLSLSIRIITDRKKLDEILFTTAEIYSQEKITCYRISDDVIVKKFQHNKQQETCEFKERFSILDMIGRIRNYIS